MKIAIVAAEAAPYAKAGGLADVIGSLPGALKEAGADPSVIVPGYTSIIENVETAPVLRNIPMRFGAGVERFSVLRASDSHGVPMYLIDHPGFFRRPGIYGENGNDYPDNMRRFIFFGRAATIASSEIIAPDIAHAHDWHASAVPIAMRADGALSPMFKQALSVFTIHNLAFQGIGKREDFALLNLDASYFSPAYLEFYGHLNLMKGAIVLCDSASTVSPTYAHEITTDPELGFGLEGVLRDKGENFVGILNGADYHEWNPTTDRQIAANYTPARPDGKRKCTRALRDSLGLPNREDWPVVGMVTRMTGQKGVDLLRDALDAVMHLDLQLVMLASGDPVLEKFFKEIDACILQVNEVTMQEVFQKYFTAAPPFAVSGKKKNEFPDAVALMSLEAWTNKNNKRVLAVSGDKDWADTLTNQRGSMSFRICQTLSPYFRSMLRRRVRSFRNCWRICKQQDARK